MERKDPKTGEKVFTVVYARSKILAITSNFNEEYEKMREKMVENLAKFQKEGSRWKYHPLRNWRSLSPNLNRWTGKDTQHHSQRNYKEKEPLPM